MYVQEIVGNILYSDITPEAIHLFPTLEEFKRGIVNKEIKSGDYVVKMLEDTDGVITYKPAMYRIINNTNFDYSEHMPNPLAKNVDVDYVQTDDVEIIPTHGHLSVQIFYPYSKEITDISKAIADIYWFRQSLVYTDSLGVLDICDKVKLRMTIYKSLVVINSITSRLHNHTMTKLIDVGQIIHQLKRVTDEHGESTLSFNVNEELSYELCKIKALVEPTPDFI